jgi:LacI family transcriptional regulator
MPKKARVAILMNLSRPYDRQIVRGIAEYVHTHASWQIYVEEDPADKIPSICRWRGDGLIVDLDDSHLFKAAEKINVRTVGIGSIPEPSKLRLNFPVVRSDDDAIGSWAAEHLAELGLKNFAYCGLPQRGPDAWMHYRYSAFERRLAELGLSCQKFRGKHYAARNWDQMLMELSKWLKTLPKPIGIMACNDHRARHLLSACQMNDFRVPDDVAVIGVDNDELTCELATPPLSSIALGTKRIGYEAARLLDRLLSGAASTRSEAVIPPLELIPRRSTDTSAVNDALVVKAVMYIREHSSEGVGVDQVAKHVNVSRSTLDSRFRTRLGRTVHDELQRVRMHAAKRLLTTTSLPTAEIAKRTGFSSVHYMNHVFRRELGVTPGEVRGRNA